jgi:hypothetical protein
LTALITLLNSRVIREVIRKVTRKGDFEHFLQQATQEVEQVLKRHNEKVVKEYAELLEQQIDVSITKNKKKDLKLNMFKIY